LRYRATCTAGIRDTSALCNKEMRVLAAKSCYSADRKSMKGGGMSFQKGAVQVIISVIFVMAIMGALGFVYWQTVQSDSEEPAQSDSSSTEDTATTAKPVTDQTDTYSVQLPPGWAKSSFSETTDDNGYFFATYSKNPTPTTSGASVTVESFSNGKYFRYSSGTPPVVEETSSVQEAYDKNGSELAQNEGLAPGSAQGGYAYKLTRERGQMNSAVFFVLQNGVLYKISVTEDETTLLSIDEQGNAQYEFPADVQEILASFKVKS
jgi:cytoskeletal protein RodZ